MKQHISSSVLRAWIPLAFVVTVLTGLVYGSVQQSYRQSANDPQIQIAGELSTILSSGAHSVDELNPGTAADIATSLSTFIIIYDAEGKPLVGSGKLNTDYPAVPKGVLDYAKAKGENRVTWQPQEGLRYAVVVRPYDAPDQSGFVLVGKSLRLVEERIGALAKMIVFGWFIALLGAFALLSRFGAASAKEENEEMTMGSKAEEKIVEASQDITTEEEIKNLDKKEKKKKKDLAEEKEED